MQMSERRVNEFAIVCITATVLMIGLGCASCTPVIPGDHDADVGGEADADAVDGDFDDVPTIEIEYPEPPALPAPIEDVAPPVMTPCPDGWTEVSSPESNGVVTCDPWPETGMLECSGGTAHFTGEDECRAVGTLCPEGDFTEWPDPTPDDREIVYVRAGAPIGGTGDELDPFGTIAEALDSVEGPAVLVLSKGTFDEPTVLDHDVVLWGACVEETTVTCTTPSATDASITVTSTAAEVRNLTISGARRGLIISGDGGVLGLEGVAIDGAEIAGVRVENGGVLTASDVIIKDTAPAADGALGRGLEVEEGGEADIERAVLLRNHDTGIFASDSGSLIRIADVAVSDTLPDQARQRTGFGLAVALGAQVEVRRGAIERSRTAAAAIMGVDTQVVLEDVIIRDTLPTEADGFNGYALRAEQGAQVELLRVVLSESHDVALGVTGEGTNVTLTDSVVRDTQPAEADQQAGRGLDMAHGARVEVVRAAFERSHEYGIRAEHSDTELILTDVVVRDTQPQASDERWGIGLEVQNGADAVVTRAVFSGNRTLGIGLWTSSTEVTLTDVAVLDTLPQEADRFGGYGMQLGEGVQVELNRGLFERNHGFAIDVRHERTLAVLRDVTARDTRAQEADGMAGSGLFMDTGAHAELERGLFEGNQLTSVYVMMEDTTLHATDLIVRDTLNHSFTEDPNGPGIGAGLIVIRGAEATIERALFERNVTLNVATMFPNTYLSMTEVVVDEALQTGCLVDNCAGGVGVGAYNGGHVDMSNFVIEDSALCGIQLAHGTDLEGEQYPEGGTMDVHDGYVARNAIGVNLQLDDYDHERLIEGVFFIDNARNWDSTFIPVPGIGDLSGLF